MTKSFKLKEDQTVNLRMAKGKKKASSMESNDGQHYKKVDDLPEERRRAYDYILEDFDKQGWLNVSKNY